jgi:insertion element IS1 protein InsB
LPAKNGDVLELDELWSFVGAKTEQLWLWAALCRRTRQIVAWTLGDRSLQSASELRASLPKGYRGRATRSDGWEAYAAAFPKHTHRCCGKADGETNHVERWFGTLRARLSRLVRKTYSFSKCAENHLDAIHLFITTYNLAIRQKATVR